MLQPWGKESRTAISEICLQAPEELDVGSVDENGNQCRYTLDGGLAIDTLDLIDVRVYKRKDESQENGYKHVGSARQTGEESESSEEESSEEESSEEDTSSEQTEEDGKMDVDEQKEEDDDDDEEDDDNDDDAVEDEEAGKELEEKAVSKGDGRAPHDNLVAGRKESRSVGTTSLSTSKTQQANAAQMNTNKNPKGDSYGVGGRGVRMPKVL